MSRCLLALLLVSSCDLERMTEQARVLAYEESEDFSDGQALRAPVPGTVPTRRDSPEKPPVTRELLERGRGRYDVYCAVCHGVWGDGDSLVSKSMVLRRPPSLVMHEHGDAARAEDHEAHEDHEAGHEYAATGLKDHEAGLKDHAADLKDHAGVLKDHEAGHEDHAGGLKDHEAGHEDREAGLKDHEAGHEEHSVRGGENAVAHLVPERIYRVISLGFGLMPAYVRDLVPYDRWAIAYYVQALRIARGIAIGDLPPRIREEAKRALSAE